MGNNWCNLKTHGKIKEIIDELDGSKLMIWLNAIYFNGVWQTEFDEKNTKKNYFYNSGGESNAKLVDKMSVKEKFNYYEDKDVQIVELPYKSDSMSAVIIIPNKNKNINDFITELNDEKLQRLFKRMDKQIVELELPKFTLEFSSLLNSVLQKMGMVIPFKGNANFTGMIDGSLYISYVIQKSYLSIDEKGTVASSVSAVVMRNEMIFPMNIDRPFLFMLRSNSLPIDNELYLWQKLRNYKLKL